MSVLILVVTMLVAIVCCASPNAHDIQQFVASMRCPVQLANTVGYEAVLRRVDNQATLTNPALIVQPKTDDDVLRTLQWVRNWTNFPLSVLGGGHSAAGYCLNSGGLVLDMYYNQGIVWDLNDPLTTTIRSGTHWKDVYQFFNGTDTIVIGGACPTVGVTGFTLGGGVSWMSRTWGLAIDNLLAVSLVLPNGTLIRASADVEPDLFWALRGGGGGNFGVVTELTFRTHKWPSPVILAGEICWTEGITRILLFYNTFAPTLPRAMALYVKISYVNGTLTACLNPFYNGRPEVGLRILAPLLNFSTPPAFVHLKEWNFLAFELQSSGNTEQHTAYIRSGVLPKNGIHISVIEIFLKFMQLTPNNASFMLWTHEGGAIDDVSATSTAYPHRGDEANYQWEVKATWSDGLASKRKSVAWAKAFGDSLAPYFSGAYLNYIDPQLSNWQGQYYKQNYARLVEIKRRYDPTNLFAFAQGIGQ